MRGIDPRRAAMRRRSEGGGRARRAVDRLSFFLPRQAIEDWYKQVRVRAAGTQGVGARVARAAADTSHPRFLFSSRPSPGPT